MEIKVRRIKKSVKKCLFFSYFLGGPMILLEGPNWNEFTIIGIISTTKTSISEPNPLIMSLRIGQFWTYIHEVTGIEPRW